MRKRCSLFAIQICAISFLLFFSLNPVARGAELSKLALDDASSLGTTISTDAAVKQEGKSSIRISTLWPTTICLAEVRDLNVENARLIYQAKVRSDKLEGTAFWRCGAVLVPVSTSLAA
jgi:hypothetical protein